MKHMKKFLAFMLALAMVLAMSVTAMADTTYTVTINATHEEHVYEAYQIFAGELDSTGKILSNITWGKNIGTITVKDEEGNESQQTFIDYLSNESTGVFKDGTTNNIFSGLTTAAEIADKLSKYAKNDKMLDVFAKEAGKFLTGTPGESSAHGTTYTITGLEAGYYLIKDKDNTLENTAHDFYTKFMLTVVGNETVSVKGNVPSVDKSVNDRIDGTYTESEDAQIGDVLFFKWEGTLPSNYDIYSSYFYRFVDTLPVGLTFNAIEKVYVLQADGDEIVIVDTNYTFGTVAVTEKDSETQEDVATGETRFTVEFNDLKASTMPTLALDDKIVVKYSAKLNENAVVGKDGNINSVVLEYDNNPYDEGEGKEDYGTTPEDVAIVFTFEMDVDKVDAADPTKTLSGAQFVLYTRDFVVTETTGVSTQATEDKVVYTYVLVDKATGKVTGTYSSAEYVVDSATPTQIWEATIEKAAAEASPINLVEKAVVTSDLNGNITVTGLDARTYRMLEIKAPDGYNLPHDPFVVIFEPVYGTDGKLIGLNYEVDTTDMVSSDANYGRIDVDIENGKGDILPSTGGIGTTIFYALGGMMVAAAVVLLVSKKRMNA